jgi:Flp pilus assembly pilin Flp
MKVVQCQKAGIARGPLGCRPLIERFRRWERNLKVKRLIRVLAVKDSAGQAMVEYALILALVAAVSVGTLKLLTAPLNDVFQQIASAF